VRVLFVSRGPIRLPLMPELARKWDAVRAELDFRVLAGGEGGDGEFRLVRPLAGLDGAAFYASLPARIARELRDFRPDAVVAQGGHETAAALAGRRLAGVETVVIADVHGDWRAPTRLYGSRLRGLLNPAADRLAESALRRADGVRTVTGYTTRLVRDLGVEPADEFPAYMDFESFLASPVAPLPEAPRAVFVGVLERYKNVDGLAEAWRRASPRIPEARLHVVGDGTLARVVERLAAELPSVSWSRRLSQAEIAAELDASTCLVLPSRSEGMGRVVIEAFCRGRPVVGSRVGGIPDLVEDGVNGLLVGPADTNGLAEALIRLLSDRALADRLAAAAARGAGRWTITPEEFARRLRELVERVAGRCPIRQ
jgi:glycosyltransferase involved in cell wall biosynthesis